MPQPTPDGQLRGSLMVSPEEDCHRPEFCPVVDRGLSDELSRQLSALVSAQSTVASTPKPDERSVVSCCG